MKRVLSNDNGLITTMEIDGDITIITKSQNITAAIEYAKKAAIERGKRITSDAYNPVAIIPAIFQVKFLQDHNLNIYSHEPEQRKRFKRVMNSSEYRFLRTSELTL